MKLKKQTEELSFIYNTVVNTFDVGPTPASSRLKDFFSVREDRYITELRIAGKTLLDPADEVFLYAELIELYEKHGITTRERLCRVPFVMTPEDLPFVKLPPFVMRQDRTYLINIKIMSATVDLNGAAGSPARNMTYIAEMLYDTKPIDFSQLPPYRCEVPIWSWASSITNTSGGAQSAHHRFRFLQRYKTTKIGCGGQAGLTYRIAFDANTAQDTIHVVNSATYLNFSNNPQQIRGDVIISALAVPDTLTTEARISVQLVPVIP